MLKDVNIARQGNDYKKKYLHHGGDNQKLRVKIMEDRISPVNQDYLLPRSIKSILLGVLMMLGMLHSFQVFAQVPVNSNSTPAESFLGEQFCFDTQFTNVGSPGFGPICNW